MGVKIPDGLTLKITTNVREKTTKILAYRKGGFKRAYKATIPMCEDSSCKARNAGPHVLVLHRGSERTFPRYHQRDIDVLVKNLIKSYS